MVQAPRASAPPSYNGMVVDLVRSWALLGASCCSWALLGAPGRSRTLLGTPGRSWALLSARGRSWSLLGTPLGAQFIVDRSTSGDELPTQMIKEQPNRITGIQPNDTVLDDRACMTRCGVSTAIEPCQLEGGKLKSKMFACLLLSKQ